MSGENVQVVGMGHGERGNVMWGAGNCEDESHNRPLKVTETTEQKKQKAMKQKAKGRNKNGIELRTQIQNHSSNHISRTEKQWL